MTRMMLLCVLLLAGSAIAESIPANAKRYQRDLIREAHQTWGLSAPVALFAAQVHQESTWRAGVSSPLGAQGLAQFMPSTAEWIAEIYPDLGVVAPYSPRWALAAMVRYDRHIFANISPMAGNAVPRCDRLAMMLSAYNGGPGWLRRDRRLALASGADPDRWWHQVEKHTARADWARRENRHYPVRIIRVLEPGYLQAGWLGEPSCA
jgi:soluble lytic murein transglycosylase-like protein